MSYPKPSAAGGTIIRKVLALLKENSGPGKLSLPIQKPIYIATSGGVDSMSLAHLIVRYGRKIIAPELVTLLHFDHQWREASGSSEKKAIQTFAHELGVKFLSVQLASQRQKMLSKNLEEDARMKRNEFFKSAVGPRCEHAFVFTAHHADDVVETLVWRFFRGELLLQSEGILFRNNNVLRPLLKVLKEEIYQYAQSEKVPFFEDPTNQDPHQMRAFFRRELLPLVSRQFPGFRTSVLSYAALQKKLPKKSKTRS